MKRTMTIALVGIMTLITMTLTGCDCFQDPLGPVIVVHQSCVNDYMEEDEMIFDVLVATEAQYDHWSEDVTEMFQLRYPQMATYDVLSYDGHESVRGHLTLMDRIDGCRQMLEVYPPESGPDTFYAVMYSPQGELIARSEMYHISDFEFDYTEMYSAALFYDDATQTFTLGELRNECYEYYNEPMGPEILGPLSVLMILLILIATALLGSILLGVAFLLIGVLKVPIKKDIVYTIVPATMLATMMPFAALFDAMTRTIILLLGSTVIIVGHGTWYLMDRTRLNRNNVIFTCLHVAVVIGYLIYFTSRLS